jgi:hypothetical protein
MKAEHRKELQTNALADLLGRTVRKARSGPGFSWFWTFVILLILAVGLGYWWITKNKARENSEAWARLDFNDRKSLEELATDFKDAKQGQAARFTLAFGYLWDGIRVVGTGDTKLVQGGVGYLFEATKIFGELADECKDDPERMAEAKYHLAVAQESLAGFDIKLLEDARKTYEELTKGDLAATPYGVLAKKRMDLFNNPSEYARVIIFYSGFRSQSPVRTGQ